MHNDQLNYRQHYWALIRLFIVTMFLHEWTTEQLVKDYGKLNFFQQAITMGLSAAEVKFLTALSDLELKRLEKEVNWNLKA